MIVDCLIDKKSEIFGALIALGYAAVAHDYSVAVISIHQLWDETNDCFDLGAPEDASSD